MDSICGFIVKNGVIVNIHKDCPIQGLEIGQSILLNIDVTPNEESYLIDLPNSNTQVICLKTNDDAYVCLPSPQKLLDQSKNDIKREANRVLVEILDGDPVPTFVIDKNGLVTYWNKACERLMCVDSSRIVGKRPWIGFYDAERDCLADLVLKNSNDTDVVNLYKTYKRSNVMPNALEAEAYFPNFGINGTWLHFTAAPIRDEFGNLDGAIETLIDITERKNAEQAQIELLTNLEQLVTERTKELSTSNIELKALNVKLADTRQQLIQSEKMVSIGQLAAGVAHEINNPIGFVSSNMSNLEKLVSPIIDLIKFTQKIKTQLPSEHQHELNNILEDLDVEYTIDDLPALVNESLEGLARVKKIVQDLKDFSRADTNTDFQLTDIVEGLKTTLTIATNEIKYVADVNMLIEDKLEIECHPGQLNQVFLNLLVNSAHAMHERKERGLITISGGFLSKDRIFIEIKDNGCGIPENIASKIFDPFFTTKPVGKGTGLGLSIAYGIIKTHNGTITLDSKVGSGTTFRIELPVWQV